MQGYGRHGQDLELHLQDRLLTVSGLEDSGNTGQGYAPRAHSHDGGDERNACAEVVCQGGLHCEHRRNVGDLKKTSAHEVSESAAKTWIFTPGECLHTLAWHEEGKNSGQGRSCRQNGGDKPCSRHQAARSRSGHPSAGGTPTPLAEHEDHCRKVVDDKSMPYQGCDLREHRLRDGDKERNEGGDRV